MINRLIIIGAGASGLMSAASLKFSKNVLILEKNNEAGKKLLISGSGQCNFTHAGSKNNLLKHYFEARNFLKPSIYTFSNEDCINFFQKNGLKIIIYSDGKVFPESLKAERIRNFLINKCLKNGVGINYQENVKSIDYKNSIFIVKTANNTYKANKVLIATGGKSYPKTGSIGDGYFLAEKLGHTIVRPKPALTPIYTKEIFVKELSGISFTERNISIIRNNKKIYNHIGDFLFTHKGLSGPGILNISRYIEKDDKILLSLVSYRNEEIFRKSFLNYCSQNPEKLIKTIIHHQNIPEKLARIILDRLNIDDSLKTKEVKKKNYNKIIDNLINFSLTVKDLGDFNKAMLTCGGISLKEVNPKTMESRIIKNLYFAGEVLNIDGETGGYNIQAAFSTGVLAIQSIFNNNF